MCGCGSEEMFRLEMEEIQREVRRDAALKAWVTRRANQRKRDYQARAQKAWITKRANKAYGSKDQSTLSTRVQELFG